MLADHGKGPTIALPSRCKSSGQYAEVRERPSFIDSDRHRSIQLVPHLLIQWWKLLMMDPSPILDENTYVNVDIQTLCLF